MNVAEDALEFTDFGDTVNEIMNTNSIESNDRWFIYDESEGLPRHVHHSVMQTLMADGLGVATITGENTFSETPGTLHLTGSGVSLAEAGGVVTATITGGGGGGGTALTKAQADDGTDTTEGLVSGLLLYDAITTHAHEFGITEVGRIPGHRDRSHLVPDARLRHRHPQRPDHHPGDPGRRSLRVSTGQNIARWRQRRQQRLDGMPDRDLGIAGVRDHLEPESHLVNQPGVYRELHARPSSTLRAILRRRSLSQIWDCTGGRSVAPRP